MEAHLNRGPKVLINLVQKAVATDLFFMSKPKKPLETLPPLKKREGDFWGGITNLEQTTRGAIVIDDGRVGELEALVAQLQRCGVVIDAARGLGALGDTLRPDFRAAGQMQGRDARTLFFSLSRQLFWENLPPQSKKTLKKKEGGERNHCVLEADGLVEISWKAIDQEPTRAVAHHLGRELRLQRGQDHLRRHQLAAAHLRVDQLALRRRRYHAQQIADGKVSNGRVFASQTAALCALADPRSPYITEEVG